MKFFTLMLFFFTTTCVAQIRITGRVIDENTKIGIPGATIYINNTSLGTNTDSLGNFKLLFKLSEKAELVISHVNFQKKIVNIQSGSFENQVFDLKPITNTLNEIVIKAKKNKKSDLTRWINLASEILIGTYNRNSELCKIKNPEALYFDFNKEKKILNVYAKAPLIIENLYLGYLIRLELDQFEYNFITSEVIFKYSTFYEDLIQKDPAVIKEHRKIAFEGSTLHFMRAVYNGKLVQEGFQVYKFVQFPNQERMRVNAKIKDKIAKAYANEEKPDLNLHRFFPKDTVKYFVEVMKQPTVLKFDTTSIAISKLIDKDAKLRTVNFNFQDTLLVNYRKPEKTDQIMEMTIWNKNLKSEKGKSSSPVQPELSSYMYFYEKGGINIEKSGYYPEMSLFMYGDMPLRRLAGALPFDFNPD